MVEAMAQERGLIATFMPKPFAHLTGNGCHMHMSLWDGDTNVFCATPRTTRTGSGLSEKGYHFIGGLKKHAKAYIALTAPTVGSYKRLVIGAPTSGATWAPGLRHLRLEQPHDDAPHPRATAGSRTAPWTAPATPTWPRPRSSPRGSTGSRTGSTRATRAPAACTRPAEDREKMGVETLPANLLDATRELEQDEVLRKALGSVGDEDYVDYFIRCKRREWQTAHEQITKWEIDRYLQLS